MTDRRRGEALRPLAVAIHADLTACGHRRTLATMMRKHDAMGCEVYDAMDMLHADGRVDGRGVAVEEAS